MGTDLRAYKVSGIAGRNGGICFEWLLEFSFVVTLTCSLTHEWLMRNIGIR